MNETIAAATRIYLDSNALIYFVERFEDLQRKVAGLIEHSVRSNKTLVMSEIGICECLCGARKMGSVALEERYREIFEDIALFEIVPLDGQRARAAALIGAEKGLKLVDAIHFVAAMERNCTVYATNDGRIRSSHGIEAIRIDAL